MEAAPLKNKGIGDDQQDWRRIRITLTSRNVKNVEEGTVNHIDKY